MTMDILSGSSKPKNEINIETVISMLHNKEMTLEKAALMTDLNLIDGTATVGYFLDHLKRGKDLVEKDGVYMLTGKWPRIGMTVIKVQPGNPSIPNHYLYPDHHDSFVKMMKEMKNSY